MGRRPQPKSDKVARGTYRPDRDKSVSVALADEIPDAPEGLGENGQTFWSEAYAQPWVTGSDRTMVALIARKLDERDLVAAQFHQAPADYWRQQRTLKEIDRDVMAGLDQLLLTPNSRRRAGIETADPTPAAPSPLQLLISLKNGEITPGDYDRQMEPERTRREAELKEQGRREQMERISDAGWNRIESLMDPDGTQRRRNGLT